MDGVGRPFFCHACEELAPCWPFCHARSILIKD
jgi:Fe-S-cluster-containing hydrogenase component 2